MTETHILYAIIATLRVLGAWLLSYLAFAGSVICARGRIRSPKYWFGVSLALWPFITIVVVFAKPRKYTA